MMVEQNRVGVLLVNLGSPEAPTASAVKPYLKQFLSDRRVVDLPSWIWQPILQGIILRKRPARSAALYEKIWLPQGSPLLVYSRSVVSKLQAWADDKGFLWQVKLAMTYGQPSMGDALTQFVQQGIQEIIVLPLFPQYSTTTTAAVFDAFAQECEVMGYNPKVIKIDDYHCQPEHINALAGKIKSYWQRYGRGEHLVMSFHGTPAATRRKGDPYYHQCLATGEALATALSLSEDQYTIAFQSRFGWQTWLQPYAEASIIKLAKSGVKHLQVICPGFAVDCLETLEEVAFGFAKIFVAEGGESFNYMPCLNDDDEQIEAIAALISARH